MLLSKTKATALRESMLTRQLVIKDGADGHKWARDVTSNWRLKMGRDLYLYSKREKATIK